jgi:hypothetical protein
MASGPVCRTQRPNTWLHRPMLQTFKKVLANSAPSTHGPKRTCRKTQSMSLLGVKQTWFGALQMSAFDPKRTSPTSPRGPDAYAPRSNIGDHSRR